MRSCSGVRYAASFQIEIPPAGAAFFECEVQPFLALAQRFVGGVQGAFPVLNALQHLVEGMGEHPHLIPG